MNSYPQKNSADASLEDIGAYFFCPGQLFLQWQGGIQFIPSDKPDPYLGGREYGHLFVILLMKSSCKLSEVQVFLVVDIDESLLVLILQSLILYLFLLELLQLAGEIHLLL